MCALWNKYATFIFQAVRVSSHLHHGKLSLQYREHFSILGGAVLSLLNGKAERAEKFGIPRLALWLQAIDLEPVEIYAPH